MAVGFRSRHDIGSISSEGVGLGMGILVGPVRWAFPAVRVSKVRACKNSHAITFLVRVISGTWCGLSTPSTLVKRPIPTRLLRVSGGHHALARFAVAEDRCSVSRFGGQRRSHERELFSLAGVPSFGVSKAVSLDIWLRRA